MACPLCPPHGSPARREGGHSLTDPHPASCLRERLEALKAVGWERSGRPPGRAEWLTQARRAELCLDGPGGHLTTPSLHSLLRPGPRPYPSQTRKPRTEWVGRRPQMPPLQETSPCKHHGCHGQRLQAPRPGVTYSPPAVTWAGGHRNEGTRLSPLRIHFSSNLFMQINFNSILAQTLLLISLPPSARTALTGRSGPVGPGASGRQEGPSEGAVLTAAPPPARGPG